MTSKRLGSPPSGPSRRTPSSPQAELLGMLADEFVAGGLDVTVVDSEEPGVPPELTMSIGSGVADRHLRVHAFFLPDIDNPPVIQYFVALPYAIGDGNEASVARFACMLNMHLPLTGFEINESECAVAFRHTHALGIRPLDPGVVAWTLTMIGSAMEQFGDVLEAVCGGFVVEGAVTVVDERLATFTDDGRSGESTGSSR